jgi:hypothetical protein
MTMSKTEREALDDDLRETVEAPRGQIELDPQFTMEEFRAAGVGVLSDDEIDDLIACVHEWRHEWVHKSEV